MVVRLGRPRLGLALGSGGLRGAAHIGVLKRLEKHSIRPHFIAGSSAGALVGALYGAGFTPSELEQMALKLRPETVYDAENLWLMLLCWFFEAVRLKPFGSGFIATLPEGLMSGRTLEKYLTKLLGKRKFSDLSPPVALLSVDVETGDSVAFAAKQLPTPDVTIVESAVVEGIRASSSIPGVFKPVHLQGRTLVDGAVKAAVPVDLVRDLGADVVVAVDLGYAGQRQEPVHNLVEVIGQSFNILGEALTKCQLTGKADLVVRPQIYDVTPRDFDRIPEIIERGAQAMEVLLPELLKML